MKKVLYVLHQKTSVAGDIGNKFKNRGFSADIVRPPLGDILPSDLTSYSAIIIFGGPMDFKTFIKHVKTGKIFYDSGMYRGNSRN